MSQNDKQPDILDWLNLRFQRNFRRSRPLGTVLGFLVVLFALFLAFLLIATLWDFMRAALGIGPYAGDTNGAAIRNIGLVLAAFFGAPFLIWRTYVAARQTAIAEESLFNDKINAAATDLGARRTITRLVGSGKLQRVLTEEEDDLVTRAAAIDRLEGLALERADVAPRIARMLSIYVQELSRVYAPLEPPKDTSPSDLFNWAHELSPARSDMERAVQSLGRINPSDDAKRDVFNPRNIDLRRCNLQSMDLIGLNFRGVQLSGASVQGASLGGAEMQGANLRMAEMQGANLRVAELQGADLRGAMLQAADLRGAMLQAADLYGAQLQGAYLGRAKLQGAVLFGAKLQGANLRGAELQGANLRGAEMQEANLRETQLKGAHLREAEMQGAILREAQLQGAYLRGVEMSEETDLTNVSLRGAAVRSVDDTTLSRLQTQDDWDHVFLAGNRADFTENWRAWAAALDPPVTIAPDYRP